MQILCNFSPGLKILSEMVKASLKLTSCIFIIELLNVEKILKVPSYTLSHYSTLVQYNQTLRVLDSPPWLLGAASERLSAEE